MWKRVLMFGAMAAIVVAAVISSLLVLDVVTAAELRRHVGEDAGSHRHCHDRDSALDRICEVWHGSR